jgi:hyperosmotically inducible periplasmic protein
MIKKNSTFILALTIFALSVVTANLITGCSTAHQQESAGQYLDSSVITTKVKSQLLADKYVKSLPITVRTYKSTVQLSGFVNNKLQKKRAVAIARKVEGVADVEDALIIKNH